tara:strand:- start:155 stop:439 length:285 start_codon:yes stop_codon:yes gene_type:complete
MEDSGKMAEWMVKHRMAPKGRVTGFQLKKWRESKGYSQQIVAVALNKDVSSISKAERKPEGFIPRSIQKALAAGGCIEVRIQITADLGGTHENG